MADDRKRDGKDREAEAKILDMGLGSREQGFKSKRPRLKLVEKA